LAEILTPWPFSSGQLLYALGSLDDYGRLAMPFGVYMAEMPLEPLLAKMVKLPLFALVIPIFFLSRFSLNVAV
jgi:hypothetical protein